MAKAPPAVRTRAVRAAVRTFKTGSPPWMGSGA
jgi:hypothetical protein